MEAAAISRNADVVGIVFEVKTYLKLIVHKGENFQAVTAYYSPL